MTANTIREVIAYPVGAGLLIWCAWWMWRLQNVIELRFQHVVARMRDDLLDMERAKDKIEAELAVVRDALRSERARCDQEIADLARQVRDMRAELARYTPPHGTGSV